MKKVVLFLTLLLTLSLLMSIDRHLVIEDFEDSLVTFDPYIGDTNPTNWDLNYSDTYNSSAVSLYLNGNNSKLEMITPISLSNSDVWEFAAKKTQTGTMTAFGVGDSLHTLFYTIFGGAPYDSVNWVNVYEGAIGYNTWYNYQIPLADDWLARYDYIPTIDRIFFINRGNGNVYFDEICDITNDLPQAPTVLVSSQLIGSRTYDNYRSMTFSFSSVITNFNDSLTYSYEWQFGDSLVSNESNPTHQYIVTDAHPYSVVLKVTDSNNCQTYASIDVDVEFGDSSFPLSVNFVGDIMLARYVDQEISSTGYNAVFQDVNPELGDADLTVGNFESSLTTASIQHPTKSIVFKGSPSNAQALNLGGIDIVTLANNHIYDYLYSGLSDTQNALNQYNILYSGAGENSYEANLPLIVNKKGVSLAFLASCDRTGSYNNYQPFLQAGFNKPGFALLSPYYLSEQLQSVNNIADFKIVEMHAGSEYSIIPGSNYDKSQGIDLIEESEDEDSAPKIDYPQMWDYALRHYAVDQGADLVIVHHPHIIQGVELYNNKLIAHSLGNFVFDISRTDCKPTMILRTKLKEDGFYDYEIIPAFIDKYYPKILRGGVGNKLLDYISWRSKDMNTFVIADRDDCIGKVVTDTTNIPHEHLPFNTSFDLSTSETENLSQVIPMTHIGYLYRINELSPPADWSYRAGRSCVWFGDFENPDFNQWNITSDGVFDSTQYYKGTYSMKITDNPPAENCSVPYKYKFRKMSTGDYSVTGFVKISNANTASIKVSYYSSFTANSPISTQTINLPLTTDDQWVQFTEPITFPTNATCYIISLNLRGDGTNTAEAWFDNIDVVEWDEWRSQNDNIVVNPNAYYYLQFKNTQGIVSAQLGYEEKKYDDIPVSNANTATIPLNLKVYQNYPNPFNPTTNIRFDLKENNRVEINIYNIKGQLVKKLLDETLEKGHHSIAWTGINNHNRRVSSGIYFFKVIAGKESKIKKMLLLK